MTLMLALSPEQEREMRRQAAEHNRNTDDYALDLLAEQLDRNGVSPQPRHFQETATPEEWVAALHEWANSHDPNGPVLLDDSREVIYED